GPPGAARAARVALRAAGRRLGRAGLPRRAHRRAPGGARRGGSPARVHGDRGTARAERPVARVAQVHPGLGPSRPRGQHMIAPRLVMLPRVPAWQAAVIGGLKLGALVIPCTASLRAKDIGYRARHSGARAIVTALDLVPEVEAALGDAPALDIRIALGGAPAGWHDFEALLSRASPTGVPARTRTDEPALCFYT